MEIMHENIETLCEDMPSGWEVEYSVSPCGRVGDIVFPYRSSGVTWVL